MSFLKEFKAFASRGNVIDMAIGVIIGVSFGKIVTSLVNDIIMPPIGLLLGGVDFSKLAIELGDPSAEGARAALKYGVFINTVIDFLIVALVIFLLVKWLKFLRKPAAINNKECPQCLMSIPINAKRCGHCTSEIK